MGQQSDLTPKSSFSALEVEPSSRESHGTFSNTVTTRTKPDERGCLQESDPHAECMHSSTKHNCKAPLPDLKGIATEVHVGCRELCPSPRDLKPFLALI